MQVTLGKMTRALHKLRDVCIMHGNKMTGIEIVKMADHLPEYVSFSRAYG